MDSAKIQTIMDWPEPRKVKDIQSFLGFANFYQCFIFDYSKIVVPLTCLTHKGTQWNFTDEAWKSAFTSAPVLTNWEPNAISILSLSTPVLSPLPSKIMTLMTKSYSPFLMLSRCGDTTWKVLACQLMWSPIIKTLSIFLLLKYLTHQQVWWSEFLSRFNLVICFCPGQLGMKLDSLTRRWDIYPKGGNSDYATINPNNLRPVFTNEQLTNSLHATRLADPVLCATVIMDQEQLYCDILQSLPSNFLFIFHSSNPKPHWSITPDSFLYHKSFTYVPDSSNLHLCILRYRHDHILSGHPGQNKTVSLIL